MRFEAHSLLLDALEGARQVFLAEPRCPLWTKVKRSCGTRDLRCSPDRTCLCRLAAGRTAKSRSELPPA